MEIKSLTHLLFENKGLRQTIFKNTFWLAIAEGISRFSGLILIIYIARVLGVTEFGKFTFALSFVSMFVVLSDFGLMGIVTREFSQDRKNEKEYPAILSFKILLSIGTLILILIGSFFITSDITIRKVIWILGFFVLITNFFLILYAFLEARQKMEYEAGAKIFQSLLIASMVFFVLFKFPSIENMSYGYLFANLVALILIVLFFHFRIYSLNLSWNKVIWQKFFIFSWPVGLAAVFGTIFLTIDSVIMGHLGQITETGWYNAARRITNFATIPAVLLGTSFYPALNRFFRESKERFQKTFNYYLVTMIVLAVPIVAGGVVLASKIINFAYNSSFNPSVLAFQILIFSTGINLLYSPYIVSLIISYQQKKYLFVILTGAVTNVVFNLILIPVYSLYGAALATVITYTILFVFAVGFSMRFTPVPSLNLRLLKVMIIIFLSTAMMLIAISQPLIFNLNILLTIIIGTLTYFTALFFFYKFLSKFNLLSEIL